MRISHVPWQELRTRYERGGETYQSLGEAYGLSKECVGRRSRAEGWRRGRKQAAEDTLLQVADALRAAVEQTARQAQGMNPKELKEMMGVLRELLQLQQMLRGESESAAAESTVQVVLEGEAEAWSR